MAEPVGILTLLLEVGRLVASPLKRQYNYLCCLNNNVRALNKEVELLEVQIDRLEEEVGHCNDNGQRVHTDVVKWLREANGIIEEVRKIEEGANNVQSGCVGIKSRYVLSKKATKMAQETKEQRDKKKFDGPIAHSAPPPAQLPPLPVRAREFPSRKEIEENVMKALSQRKPGVIGICGMGGLGKTTMAKKLMERVNKDNLFDEMVMVVVGQDATDFNIQRDIAEWLKFPLEEESIPARACALRHRLSGGKRIFIVMDDIWKQPEFEDLGIPCEACTILLTSRNVDLLKRMDNKVDVEVFTMELLNDEEALDLFIEKARMDRGDENLVPIAKEFVQECQGLPLTLVIIGSLLKDEKETATWNDMLLRLRSFNIENIPDFDEKVYRSLKFSFDKLNSVDAKKLLLLCSQFPEDSDVELEDLALYCMSLRLFEDINSNVKQTRDRVQAVIKMLKSRSLLLDGSGKNSVKMHDLVRDVAIVIAKKGESDEKLRSHSVNYCKWISEESLNECRDLSVGFGLLGIGYVDPSTVEDLISQNGMAELNSLVLVYIAFQSLPQSMRHLMNLRMLHLENCDIECISIVGELLGLEILKCLDCRQIKELPLEIKKLKHLKVLELKKCPNLEIVPGVISNLFELEELTIRNCFKDWESINATGEYVSLKELESLKKLKVLIIEIGDVNLVEENVQLDASSLAKYGIRVGEEIHLEDGSFKYEKYLYLNEIPQGVKLRNWIYQLMSTTEHFVCKRVKELHELVPFKNLKELVLESLPNLTHLWKTSNQNASLNHLWKIDIQECHNLKNLFFFHAEDASNCHITFPQLETLRLN